MKIKFSKVRSIKKKYRISCCTLIIAASIILPLIVFGYFETPYSYDVELSTTFKEASAVPIGVAVNVNKLRENEQYRDLVIEHFDSLTAENHMKWMYVEPSENQFYWNDSDYIVEFAGNHSMIVHGHCLVWHQQLPSWVENYEGTTEEWELMLKNHIQTVASHYKGQIATWDVVNEAFENDGYRKNIWYEHIGPDYIKKAFIWAHEADPDAKLYYNDFSILKGDAKFTTMIEAIKELLDEGVPIHGIGFQAHITDTSPLISNIESTLNIIDDLNLSYRVSELDISMNQFKTHREYTKRISDSQCERYYEVTNAFCQSPYLTGVTTWGLSDADSWIPAFNDRIDWPLLFDSNYQPKPAAQCFINVLENNYS